METTDTVSLSLLPNFRFIHGSARGAAGSRAFSLGHEELLDLLRTRLANSDGGAFLLGGFRGTGKSTLVDDALTSLRAQESGDWWVSATVNVARRMTSSELLFAMMRRLVEALDESGVLQQLPPKERSDVLLSYARTSMSITRKNSEGHEYGSSAGLSVPGPSIVTSLLGKPSFQWSSKATSSKAMETSFLAYSDGDVEHDFLKIVDVVTKRPVSRPSGWFGRLRRHTSQVRLVVVLDELDKLTDSIGGFEAFETVLGSLKNILIKSGLHLIVVAGVDVLDRFEADGYSGIGIYESVFSWHAYVPCLWAAPGLLLDGVLPPQLPRHPDLLGFLSYKSRGVPRRLLQEFNELVRFDGPAARLEISAADAHRMELYARLTEAIDDFVVELGLRERSGLAGDRLTLLAFYAADWILRTEGAVFRVSEMSAEIFPLAAALSSGRPLLEQLVEHFAGRVIVDKVLGGVTLHGTMVGSGYAEPVYRLSEDLRDQLMKVSRTSPRELTFLLMPAQIKAPPQVPATRPPGPYGSSTYIVGPPAPVYASAPYSSFAPPPQPSPYAPPPPPPQSSSVALSPEDYVNLPDSMIGQRPDFSVPVRERFLAGGRYELVDLIAVGGMGAVYRARQTDLQEDRAIKLLPSFSRADAQMRARFRREADVLSRVHHPRVVALLDTVEEWDGRFALVMPFIEGTSLGERLREGHLSESSAIKVGIGIAEAIQACHDSGIYRLDVKPSNVILQAEDDDPILVDLGIARTLDDHELTQPGSLIGTPVYMAPEQLNHSSVPDGRVDVYGLGVTLFEALGGDLKSSSVEDLRSRIGRAGPDVATLECSQGLKNVLTQLLKLDPGERAGSASAARHLLAQLTIR